MTPQIYAIKRPCSNAKTISKVRIRLQAHLKRVLDKLHLSGGPIDLLIRTDYKSPSCLWRIFKGVTTIYPWTIISKGSKDLQATSTVFLVHWLGQRGLHGWRPQDVQWNRGTSQLTSLTQVPVEKADKWSVSTFFVSMAQIELWR